MTNEVAKTSPFGGSVAPIDPSRMSARLKESVDRTATGAAPDGSDYVTFSGKKGVYMWGQDKAPIDPEELFLVNVYSFSDGWICWKGGKSMAQRMRNVFEDAPIPAPDVEEFGPFDTQKGEGWSDIKAMIIRSCDQDDRQGYFSTSSTSGVQELDKLLSAVRARVDAGLSFFPVVRLTSEEFTSKGFTNSKPVFAVEGYLSDAQIETLANDPSLAVTDLLADEGDSAPPAVDEVATAEPKDRPVTEHRRGRSRARARR